MLLGEPHPFPVQSIGKMLRFPDYRPTSSNLLLSEHRMGLHETAELAQNQILLHYFPAIGKREDGYVHPHLAVFGLV